LRLRPGRAAPRSLPLFVPGQRPHPWHTPVSIPQGKRQATVHSVGQSKFSALSSIVCLLRKASQFCSSAWRGRNETVTPQAERRKGRYRKSWNATSRPLNFFDRALQHAQGVKTLFRGVMPLQEGGSARRRKLLNVSPQRDQLVRRNVHGAFLRKHKHYRTTECFLSVRKPDRGAKPPRPRIPPGQVICGKDL
jgi:hypothetical protein